MLWGVLCARLALVRRANEQRVPFVVNLFNLVNMVSVFDAVSGSNVVISWTGRSQSGQRAAGAFCRQFVQFGQSGQW